MSNQFLKLQSTRYEENQQTEKRARLYNALKEFKAEDRQAEFELAMKQIAEARTNAAS